MSLVVYVAGSGVRPPLSAAMVVELARGVFAAKKITHAMLSVTFVTSAVIAKLNRQHLGKRGSTDVIAFVLSSLDGDKHVMGDIYICPDVARRNAHRYGSSIREETARLVIHGTLHVLGYDHAEGDGRTNSVMWKKQEALLRRLYTRRTSPRQGGR